MTGCLDKLPAGDERQFGLTIAPDTAARVAWGGVEGGAALRRLERSDKMPGRGSIDSCEA